MLLAVHSGGRARARAAVAAIGGGAIPTFFIGLLLQLVFYGWLGWLPLNGRLERRDPDRPSVRAVTGVYLVDALLSGDRAALWSVVAYLVLPVAALAMSSVAIIARTHRQPDDRGAGLGLHPHRPSVRRAERLIHYRLALRPAMTQVLTVIGLTYGFLLGNSVFVEFVFDWQGLGEDALRAVLENDYPAVMGVTLVLSGAYLLVNLIIDLVNLAVDPRLRAA